MVAAHEMEFNERIANLAREKHVLDREGKVL